MRSMFRLWHRTVICLGFVISQKLNFYFLTQNKLEKAFSSRKFAVSENQRVFSTKVSFHLGPQVLSLLPGMVESWSFLESLTAEQNRHCAILQGNSKEQKIHRLSPVWRGSFWIHGLDSFEITLGDGCCKQGSRYHQHLPSLPMGLQQGVVVAEFSQTSIPVCFFSISFLMWQGSDQQWGTWCAFCSWNMPDGLSSAMGWVGWSKSQTILSVNLPKNELKILWDKQMTLQGRRGLFA